MSGRTRWALVVALLAALVAPAHAAAATEKPQTGAPFKVSFVALQDSDRPGRLRVKEIAVNHLQPGATLWYSCDGCHGPKSQLADFVTARTSRHVFRIRDLVATRHAELSVEVQGDLFARRRTYDFRPSQGRLVLDNEFCYSWLTYGEWVCSDTNSIDLWATMSSCQPGAMAVQAQIPPIAKRTHTVAVRYSLQYLSGGEWEDVEGTATPFATLGSGLDPHRASHTFGPLSNAAGRTFRGVVDIQWNKPSYVKPFAIRRYTTAGRVPDATAVPPGFSAAACTQP